MVPSASALGPRRRKSARERREQSRRAEARAVGRVLRLCDAVSNHRGCQPSKLLSAVAAALKHQSAPPGPAPHEEEHVPGDAQPHSHDEHRLGHGQQYPGAEPPAKRVRFHLRLAEVIPVPARPLLGDASVQTEIIGSDGIIPAPVAEEAIFTVAFPSRTLFNSLKGTNLPKELSDALVSAGQDFLASFDGALNLLSTFTDSPTLSSEAAPPAPPPVPTSGCASPSSSSTAPAVASGVGVPGFLPGERVSIFGLARRPDLNGTGGTVVSYRTDCLRYAISCVGLPEPILVKVENLVPFPGSSLGSSGSSSDGEGL